MTRPVKSGEGVGLESANQMNYDEIKESLGALDSGEAGLRPPVVVGLLVVRQQVVEDSFCH
jgi:hypothetical protein